MYVTQMKRRYNVKVRRSINVIKSRPNNVLGVARTVFQLPLRTDEVQPCFIRKFANITSTKIYNNVIECPFEETGISFGRNINFFFPGTKGTNGKSESQK